MPTRIAAARQPASRSISFDVGPALIRATSSVGTNTDNPTIDRLAGDISQSLKRAGVKDTRFVGEMLYQMRGTQLGVGGDKARFISNVNKAAQLGVLGPRGKATLLGNVGAAAGAQDNRSRVENSMLNQPQKKDLFENLVFLKGTPARQDIFAPVLGQQKQAQKAVVQPQANVPTPKLDTAIDSLDKATKAMPDGVVKQSLVTVKSSLELARTAQKNGDTVAYTKAIGGLAENMMKTVGAVVKRFGQDGALAEQAAAQLGKLAGFIGKGVKVVGMVDDLSKVLSGKSLSGVAATKGQRADAAVDLVTTVVGGPVGTAIKIAKAELEWCYANIGVPAKEALTSYGLKRLFNGQTAEQLRDQVRSLPVDDPKKAQWALYQLYAKTFPNVTSGFSQATAAGMWKRFIASELQGYNQQMQLLNEHKNTKPGENPIIDEVRTKLASVYQQAALRFIDAQVRDAKGSWPV